MELRKVQAKDVGSVVVVEIYQVRHEFDDDLLEIGALTHADSGILVKQQIAVQHKGRQATRGIRLQVPG